MTCRTVIILLLASGFLSSGCNRKQDIDEQRITWTTDAPLTIPLRARLQRLEKGNLLRNPSFETGRTFTLDTARSSFVIDGWQQTGHHVRWVDIRSDSLYRPDEVFSGNRSVRIIRENAYETDEVGDGIMSEFIKVIPGNYDFSFHARLENIVPPRARIGTRMYDAVEVKLLFYDRNKIEITARRSFPQIDQVINISFKSLSFANYQQIKEFNWGKIIGKSEHFPFPEGDIPTEAHYVRIYIGLKASGKLWIDSVSLTYSHRNFSVAERMRAYTDTTYTEIASIIPVPKSYQRMESVVYQVPETQPEKQPLIVIPDQAPELILKSAALIRDALNLPQNRVVTAAGPDQIRNARLVFSLGATPWFEQYRAFLPEKAIAPHPQGYFIYATSAMPHLVFLGSQTSQGIYYAALTLVQMIDKKQPVYHHARIIDYPDFANRWCSLPEFRSADPQDQRDYTDDLVQYKINGAFTPKATGGNVRINGLFTVSTMPDFPVPAEGTLTYPGFPDAGVPPFHNQMLDYSLYMNPAGHCPAEVSDFYAGCSYFSMNTDDADLRHFLSRTKKKPMFMDNSMQMHTPWAHFGGNDPWYPGKVRLYNLFEPYGNDAIKDHFYGLDSSRFWINLAAGSETDIIRLATAADFMWNAASYNRDRSLWKVLQSRYGAEASREIIRYADQYGLMMETLLRMRVKTQLQRNLKNAQQILSELNRLVHSIGQSIGPDHPLVKELGTLTTALQDRMTFLLN